MRGGSCGALKKSICIPLSAGLRLLIVFIGIHLGCYRVFRAGMWQDDDDDDDDYIIVSFKCVLQPTLHQCFSFCKQKESFVLKSKRT